MGRTKKYKCGFQKNKAIDSYDGASFHNTPCGVSVPNSEKKEVKSPFYFPVVD